MWKGACVAAAAAVLGWASPALAAGADDWPQRPVEIVVPYAPGGTSDTLGRIVAQGLTQKFKQPFNVENRPGAGGTVGSAQVAKTKPDGYSLVISGVGSHIVAPAINPNISFDPIKDFTHIAVLGGPPSVMVVNPSLGVKDVAGFVALLKGGTPVSYASPGAGTQGHLVGEYFKTLAGVQMTHIPYRGAGASIADLISGVVPAGSFTLSSAAAQIRAGTLVPLAVTSPQRLAQFPDVPTFVESGYPDLVATVWFALSGPAGMPPELTAKINGAVNEIMASDAAKKALDTDAIVFQPMQPDAVAAFFQSERDRWSPVAAKSGAKIE